MSAPKTPEIVQVQNPKTGLYTKINRTGGTLTHKKSPGPFKGIPIAPKPHRHNAQEPNKRTG